MTEIYYREEKQKSQKYKQTYLDEIKKIIADREQTAAKKREDYFQMIFRDQERYREAFRAMLGWPLTETRNPMLPKAEMELLQKDKGCDIYRMTVEVMEGFHMTGLLFQKDKIKRPLVIAQHGGLGTPELVGNLYGNTENYNHMIERMLNYNVHIFAPQLLIWDPSYQVEFDRGVLDAQLKRVGSSITALEVYGLTRILDYFEAQDYVSNFGMLGLSYGGFYTLFTAAVDTRIKSSISCSFFNTRQDYAWSDWTWFCSAEFFSDAEVACLIYPRKLCIEVGTEDELFSIRGARAEAARLKAMSSAVEDNWLEIIEFQGKHEFCLDDVPLKQLADNIQ